MKTSFEAEIEHPADLIDLVEWLCNLTDREYQACSPAHRAAGSFREGDTFGSVNVESVGGHLLIHHYLAAAATPNHLVMHSKDIRVYVMHTFPATIEVIWTLDVEPKGGERCVFRCTVETLVPQPLAFLASLGLLPLFLRWHVQGETPLFARDIARKIAGAQQASNGADVDRARVEAGHGR
jgi:hypothetical protein